MTTIQSILSRLTEAVSGTDKQLFNEQELRKSSLHSILTSWMRTQAKTLWQSLLWTIGGTLTELAEDALNVAN